MKLKELETERKEMHKNMVKEAIPKSPLIKEILGPTPKKFEKILKENGIAVIE